MTALIVESDKQTPWGKCEKGTDFKLMTHIERLQLQL